MQCRLRQLLRFCMVGLTCFLVGLGVLAGLHILAGVNYLVAFVASFIICNVAGYLLNARFTFSSVRPDRAGAARYVSINAALLCVNSAAMRLLVSDFRMWYLAAAILLAAVNAPVTFIAQRLFTYREEQGVRAAGA